MSGANLEQPAPRIIELPKNGDRRGNLSFIEGSNHIPFEIVRTYWIYDVPGGASRGGHAYFSSEEFIVALSGSFDVVVDCGNGESLFALNRSYYGLYIPRMAWRVMQNFSTNSLALILSSSEYSESDYIRDREEFQKLIRRGG